MHLLKYRDSLEDGVGAGCLPCPLELPGEDGCGPALAEAYSEPQERHQIDSRNPLWPTGACRSHGVTARGCSPQGRSASPQSSSAEACRYRLRHCRSKAPPGAAAAAQNTVTVKTSNLVASTRFLNQGLRQHFGGSAFTASLPKCFHTRCVCSRQTVASHWQS